MNHTYQANRAGKSTKLHHDQLTVFYVCILEKSAWSDSWYSSHHCVSYNCCFHGKYTDLAFCNLTLLSLFL